jgi:hypothetical protein
MDDFPLVTIQKKGKLINLIKGKFSVQIEAKCHPNVNQVRRLLFPRPLSIREYLGDLLRGR